jgi:polyisoprenoid-binding protein YceI
MAPPETTTAPALQDLLSDGTLTGDWVLDPSRSTVSLKSKSMGGLAPVHGVFRRVTGTGTVSPAGEVTGTITVAAASIDTRNTKRDTHLRSGDFFDSDNYPDITFTADGIRPSGQGVTVTGTLGVRDRAGPLTVDATAAVHGNGEVWLDAEVRVNRADFGLAWNLLGLMSTKNVLTIHAIFTSR